MFPLHRDDRGPAKIIASANGCTGLPPALKTRPPPCAGRPPSSRVTSLAGAPDPAITRAAPFCFWRIPAAPVLSAQKERLRNKRLLRTRRRAGYAAHRLTLKLLLRLPGDERPVPLSIARRGQRSVARLSVPSRRYRDQQPVQDRHDLGADDLCPADLSDTPAPGPAGATVAMAGSSDRPARTGICPACRSGPPAVYQDPHAAGRDSPRPPSHLHSGGPASARHGRVALPPG